MRYHPISSSVESPLRDRLRDRQAERLRSLEVDDQLELSRLLDGEIGGPPRHRLHTPAPKPRPREHAGRRARDSESAH
jgi:hypothetical protein